MHMMVKSHKEMVMASFRSLLDDRMPPKLDANIKRLNLIAPTSWVRKVDDWRRRQADVPNLSAAIRRLVEIALENEKKGGRRR